MTRIVFRGNGQERLPGLLEGYLFALGESCHTLFGPVGELAMYRAIGSVFIEYLGREMGVEFDDDDPWSRYCRIVEVFTGYGFYAHVELEELADGRYWMFESGQYASEVWESQKAWERGTPPCPLWSVMLHSLSEIGYEVILDEVEFKPESKGYVSTFHFEPAKPTRSTALEHARSVLRDSLIPLCARCKRVRDGEQWLSQEHFFGKWLGARVTHGFCPECCEELYPGVLEEVS